MSINDAATFNQLQTVLTGANIVGSNVFDASGAKIGHVSDLQSKMKQLYQTQVVDNPNIMQGREAANEFCNLIFLAEQLPRQQSLIHRIAGRFFGHDLDEVKSLCMERMRQDPTFMQRITEKYNVLAKNWNAQVNYLHNDPNMAQNPELKQLRYLNGFIGLAWSPQQENGREALPLYGEFDSFVEKVSSDVYKPSQCETMQQLSTLLKRAKESNIEGGFPEEMINQIEDRIDYLYHKASHLPSTSAGPRALETMEAIYVLDSLRPPKNERSRKLNKLWDECRTTFSQDTPLLLKFHRAYNKGIKYVNNGFICSCGESRTMHKFDAQKIPFYGAVLGLKMPQMKESKEQIDYYEVSNIFPESHVSLTQEEIQIIEQDFSFRTLLLNLQIELVRMRARLAVIEQTLDGTNLTTLLIEPETKLKLEQERRELLMALKKMPPSLPKHVFKAIWEEQLKRMELLQITPTQGQKNMSEPLPILGFDLPSPVKVTGSQQWIGLPFHIKWYNQRVDISNTTLVELELKRKIVELKQLIRDDPLIPSDNNDNKIKSDIKLLREAEKNYEEWKTSVEKTRGWGVAITLEFRSKLIQLAEIFPFVKITREQILGEVPWPRIDIAQVTRPPDEKLIPELEQLDAKGIAYFWNKWPEHWKTNLSDNLQKVIAHGLTFPQDNR